MSSTHARLISLIFSGALTPARALEWEAVPPLPPISTATATTWESPTVRSASEVATGPRKTGLVWQLDPDPAGMGQPLAIAWETVPSGEEMDPQDAIAADAERKKAYQQAMQPLSNPFRPLVYTPYLAGFQPSAYINQWGEGWVGGFGSTADNFRDGTVDASLNMRLGLGDPDKFLAIQAGWDIASYRNLNANGSFDIRIARVLYESPKWQITAGGGLLEFGRYGNETGRLDPNGYGVVSFVTPLRHHQPDFTQLLQFSLGVGGNKFAPVPGGEFLPSDTLGYFMAVGLQATPNVGVSLGRSGRGANAVLSLLPDKDLPLYLEAAAVDLFDESAGGRVGVFSVRYGGRNLYRPRNPSPQEPSTEAAADNQSRSSEDVRVAADASVAQASKDNTSTAANHDISLQKQKQDNLEIANEKPNQSDTIKSQERSTEAAADNQSQSFEDLRALADASVAHASQQESPQPALFAEEDSGDSQKTRVTHSESSSKLIVPPIASESTEAALNSTNDMAVRENIQPKSSPRSQSSTRLNSALIPIPITSEINIQPKESIDKLTEILGTDPPSAASQKARRDSAINANTEARALLYLIAQISSPDQLAQLKEIAPVSFAINPVAASSNAKKLAQVGIYTDTRTGHLLMRQTLNELQRIGIEAWVSRSGLDAQP